MRIAIIADQSGVRPTRIILELETGAEAQLNHDSSTNALIRRYRRSRETLGGEVQ